MGHAAVRFTGLLTVVSCLIGSWDLDACSLPSKLWQSNHYHHGWCMCFLWQDILSTDVDRTCHCTKKKRAQFPSEFHLAVFEDSPVDLFIDSFCRVSDKLLCLLGGPYGSCFCNHIAHSLLRIVRLYMCFKLLGSAHVDLIQAKHKLSLRKFIT